MQPDYYNLMWRMPSWYLYKCSETLTRLINVSEVHMQCRHIDQLLLESFTSPAPQGSDRDYHTLCLQLYLCRTCLWKFKHVRHSASLPYHFATAILAVETYINVVDTVSPFRLHLLIVERLRSVYTSIDYLNYIYPLLYSHITGVS